MNFIIQTVRGENLSYIKPAVNANRRQGDSLGGCTEPIIINHIISYRQKWNLSSTYCGLCGDVYVKKMLKLASTHRDTQAHRTVRVGWYHIQHGTRDDILKEVARSGQTSTRVSVEMHTVLPTFVVRGKLFRDLWALIPDFLWVNHHVVNITLFAGWKRLCVAVSIREPSLPLFPGLAGL